MFSSYCSSFFSICFSSFVLSFSFFHFSNFSNFSMFVLFVPSFNCFIQFSPCFSILSFSFSFSFFCFFFSRVLKNCSFWPRWLHDFLEHNGCFFSFEAFFDFYCSFLGCSKYVFFFALDCFTISCNTSLTKMILSAVLGVHRLRHLFLLFFFCCFSFIFSFFFSFFFFCFS